MKELGRILFGFLCALLAVGIIQLLGNQPRGNPIQLATPYTPAPLTIHVSGAVRNPGVYQLTAGSRVWDAIQQAGGFTNQADQNALNLAEKVADGSRVYIPSRQVGPAPQQQYQATVSVGSPDPTSSPTLQATWARIKFPIDINTASAAELELLPEIGQVRAARILGYRQRNGYFKKIEDIRNVYDITPEVFAAIRDLITASQPLGTPLPGTAAPTP